MQLCFERPCKGNQMVKTHFKGLEGGGVVWMENQL